MAEVETELDAMYSFLLYSGEEFVLEVSSNTSDIAAAMVVMFFLSFGAGEYEVAEDDPLLVSPVPAEL